MLALLAAGLLIPCVAVIQDVLRTAFKDVTILAVAHRIRKVSLC